MKNVIVVGIASSLLLGLAAHARSQVPFDAVVVDTDGPSDPWMKTVGDIDGDGQVDLLVAGRSGPIVWYRFPTWTKAPIYPAVDGGSTTDMEAGDVDGDGDLDVVLANGRWYENPRPGVDPGAGPWTQHTIDTTTAHDVLLADFDLDGDLDVAKRDQGSGGATIRLFRQDGPDLWTPRTLSAPTGEGITTGDIDADGDPDVIVGGTWYENTRDVVGGPWAPHSYTDSYTYANVVAAAHDLNRDGRLDILLSPSEPGDSSYRVSWFEAPSDPRTTLFTEHILREPAETVYHGLMVADFDNDRDPDVVIAEMHQSADPDEVVILLNEANASSWTEQPLSTQGSHNVQVADVDGDGDIDIFGANWNDGAPDGAVIRLWRNRLDSGPPPLGLDQWQRHVIDASRPWTAVFVDAGDLNADGLRDVVSGGWWYENPGDPGGSWIRRALGSPLNNMAAVHDFDGDGDLDVLGTEGQGSSANDSFVWARNDGSGSFSIVTNVAAGDGDFLQGVAVDRFSNGGPIEAALSWHAAGAGIQMLTVPSDPSAEPWTWRVASTVSQDEQLSSGDVDRDGDRDLLLGTTWLRNDAAAWSPFTVNGTAGSPDRNRLADVNGDGRLDAVVGFEAISVPGKLAWYEQPSVATATWTEHVIASVVGPMSLDVADMDDDGDLDVVVGEHNLSVPSSAALWIFENMDGLGTSWTQHEVHTGDEHHDGAQVVDIDNDGDLDVISIGWGHDQVLLYENLALDDTVVDVTPPTLVSATTAGDPQHVQVVFSEALDPATAASAAHYQLSGGATVTAPTLAPGGERVSLTTSTLAAGFTYTLTVDDVEDLAGNVIAPGSQIDFTHVPIDLAEGLVAFWPFSEGNGTTTADVSGHGHTGTLGEPTWASGGRIGYALSFDGSDDAVDTGMWDITGEALTISLWFNATSFSTTDARLFSKATSSAEQAHTWMMSTVDNGGMRLRFRLRTAGTTHTLIASSGLLTTGAWTHVAAVYDGTTMRLYKDGIAVGSAAKSGTLSTDSSVGVTIGRNPDGYGPFHGLIDEVRVYDRALSLEEIQVLSGDARPPQRPSRLRLTR